MKRIAWTLQILLTLAFGAAGTMKLITPKDQLVANGMGWANDFSHTQVQLIGAAEVLGAVGLVVPAATDILPVLTPTAAAGLTVLMAGAAMMHLQRGEPPVVPLVVGLLAAIVVWLRLRETLARSRVTV
ncbi:MAG: DoxX family protein [Acidimicrobiia bacterium]|nr:DoxX family protein [Acidimicrobiia bacterium]